MSIDCILFSIKKNIFDSFDLQNDLIDLRASYEWLKPLHIVQPFFMPEQPGSNLKSKALLYVIFLCFAGYCVIGYRKKRAAIKAWITKE
jgi:hypothetical protein